jgi:hypothetical protein
VLVVEGASELSRQYFENIQQKIIVPRKSSDDKYAVVRANVHIVDIYRDGRGVINILDDIFLEQSIQLA